MFGNKKLNIFFLILLVLVVAGLGIVLGLSLNQPNPNAPSAYSVVNMTDGNIYFGKLSWFPWPHLDDVWLINKTVGQGNQPQLGVAQLTKELWEPVDKLYLNPKNIISWTSLRQDSQLAQYFTNPSLAQQQAQQQSPAVNTSTLPSVKK